MSYTKALSATHGQSFNSWPRSDTFMQIIVERIVNDLGLTAPIVAIFRHRMINEVEKRLKRETPAIKKLFSPPHRFCQPPLVSHWTKLSETNAVAASIAMVEIWTTNLVRKSCMKAHSSLSVTVIFWCGPLPEDSKVQVAQLDLSLLIVDRCLW